MIGITGDYHRAIAGAITLSELSLYCGKQCYRSNALRAFVESYQIQCSVVTVQPDDPTFEQTCYEQTPFFKFEDKVIEDIRLMLLFLDELVFDFYTRTAPAAELAKLYSGWEVLDTEILPEFAGSSLTGIPSDDLYKRLLTLSQAILANLDFKHPLTSFPVVAFLANYDFFSESPAVKFMTGKIELEAARSHLKSLYESFGTSPITLAGTPATIA